MKCFFVALALSVFTIGSASATQQHLNVPALYTDRTADAPTHSSAPAEASISCLESLKRQDTKGILDLYINAPRNEVVWKNDEGVTMVTQPTGTIIVGSGHCNTGKISKTTLGDIARDSYERMSNSKAYHYADLEESRKVCPHQQPGVQTIDDAGNAQ